MHHNYRLFFTNQITWITVLALIGAIAVDYIIPPGLIGTVAYIPFILLSQYFVGIYRSYQFALLATLCIVTGIVADAWNIAEPTIRIINQFLAILILWMLAFLIYRNKVSIKKFEQSQGHLHAVVNHVLDGLITINAKGKIESFNPACERIFGYSADEMLGKNVKMLMPEPYKAQHDQYIQNYHDTKIGKIIGTAGREVKGMRKDGSTFPIDLSVSAFHFAGEVHFSGIVRDITDRKEAEAAKEQLRQSQKMEALGQLTGGVAHDFNNLLAIILGNLDLLSEKLQEEHPLQRYVVPSIEAALQGSELTSRLLSFGRKQALRPKTISVNDLIDYFSRWVRRVVNERIEIDIKLDMEIWPISVDTSQLQNALLNLSVNARDAMPNGGRLFLETKNITLDSSYTLHNPEVRAGDYVMIAVTDTGVGMSPDIIDKVFDPFFTTKAEGKGSGLGLSMVYGFVKQSEGHIKIYSEPDVGTSIKIYLPRAEGEVSSFAETFQDTSIAEIEHGIHVLVVEDNPSVLQLTSDMVESLGFRVSVASTGDEALKQLAKHDDIKLLLSDVMLAGGLNGPQLAKIALEKYPHLKVIFNSGYAEDAMRQSGMLEEGVHLLGKPFRKLQLAQKIKEVLHE